MLQIGAASLLQIGANVVTSWGSYHKLGQPLLQNRAAIISYYFTKFAGKHLCQSLFFNKFAGLGLQLYLRRDSGMQIY